MSVIREIGDVITSDEDGFLVNPCAPELVRPPWDRAVGLVVEAYAKAYGADLHSVYLRGSVAKGSALVGVSDVDSFAVLRSGASESSPSWGEKFWARHGEDLSFSEGVEIIVLNKDELLDPGGGQWWWRFALASQCLCVDGEDLIPGLPRVRARRSEAGSPEILSRHLARFERDLGEGAETDGLAAHSTWVLKHVLRCAFLLVMEDTGVYTRDLYPCYRHVADHYPEQEPALRQALEWALSPPPSQGALQGLVDVLGNWVLEEAARLPAAR